MNWNTFMILVATLATSTSFEARARASGRRPPLVDREIVLEEIRGKRAAQREIVRAAIALQYRAALDTSFRAPQRRVVVGPAITARRDGRDRFVISSFLGSEAESTARLTEARRFFPSARSIAARSPVEDTVALEDDDAPFYPASILVVASDRSYYSALRTAREFGLRSGISYDGQGMIFDCKRGLIVPDDDPDEAFAGRYVSRRDDRCGSGACTTIERSDAYEGFSRDLYIVVAGVVTRGEEAQARLAEARRFAPDAYLKDTVLYMGCRH